MTDELPHRLGRLVQHDPRSRGYPARAAAAPRPLVSKTWRRYGATLDQGDLGACTGYAMTHGLNTAPLRVAGPTHTHTTAVNLYSEATTLDAFPGVYPPVDTGSSGLAVCKAAQARKLITSYRWAFGLQQTLQALLDGPVLVGTMWTERMFYPNSAGVVTVGGAEVGGHEYLAVGLDVRAKTCVFVNSWGPGWGVNGRFAMTWESLEFLLGEQGDAVQPIR